MVAPALVAAGADAAGSVLILALLSEVPVIVDFLLQVTSTILQYYNIACYYCNYCKLYNENGPAIAAVKKKNAALVL